MTQQTITDDMRACIRNCSDCHDTCLETIQHCLHMGGRHVEANHIRLMADCVQICQASRDFLLRGSHLHHVVCGVCAQVCELCAFDCDKLNDDEKMRACAQTCRRCSASCRHMSVAVD
jgi:hypothetical protein